MDQRTPVIVGAAQLNNRSGEPAEPVAMMVASTRDALAQAGVQSSMVEAMRVVRGIWPYQDPGRLVADRLGVTDTRTTITSIGGNEVFDLTIDTAARIQHGELDVAVICAAETLRTRRRDHAAGRRTEYLSEAPGAVADEAARVERPTSSAEEDEIGISRSAVGFYSLVESAIRHAAGENVAAHRKRIGALWQRANAVAVRNPRAWISDPMSAGDIATPSAQNRMVSDPYPKLMTANVNVDQGASIVMMSAGAAENAGVPRSQWVFPHAGVGAHDHWHATNRWAMHESPAMRLAGRRALELASLGVDDLRFVDLYSCFPSAVQVAQAELGIDPERDFTVTGGLTFAGGPLNCYCMLSLVRTVELLREQPRERALVTGNGGFFTKHSFVVLAAEPPASGFVSDTVQAQVDALPSRHASTRGGGDHIIEAYTVSYGRDGTPEEAILACLDQDGGRRWASSDDADLCAALIAEDHCGRMAHVAGRTASIV